MFKSSLSLSLHSHSVILEMVNKFRLSESSWGISEKKKQTKKWGCKMTRTINKCTLTQTLEFRISLLWSIRPRETKVLSNKHGSQVGFALSLQSVLRTMGNSAPISAFSKVYVSDYRNLFNIVTPWRRQYYAYFTDEWTVQMENLTQGHTLLIKGRTRGKCCCLSVALRCDTVLSVTH